MTAEQPIVRTQDNRVTMRPASPDDAVSCGTICYEAFAAINRHHNFPPELPAPEPSIGLMSMLFSHPGFYCVVAELDGRIVGSNCLDERSPIAGVGPITVDPTVQNAGIGRQLMTAVMDRAREKNFAGVRLLQAAFHSRSLSLYSKLGFAVREPISAMNGTIHGRIPNAYVVRVATEADLVACSELCTRVHGHHREGEMADAILQKAAKVVFRNGRITGYATGFGYFAHAVAETNDDLKALILSMDKIEGPGILVPTRNTELFQWCLASGLRVAHPMTLMTMGLYSEPRGAWLPSVLY